jgi:hypothetical protein
MSSGLVETIDCARKNSIGERQDRHGTDYGFCARINRARRTEEGGDFVWIKGKTGWYRGLARSAEGR